MKQSRAFFERNFSRYKVLPSSIQENGFWGRIKNVETRNFGFPKKNFHPKRSSSKFFNGSRHWSKVARLSNVRSWIFLGQQWRRIRPGNRTGIGPGVFLSSSEGWSKAVELERARSFWGWAELTSKGRAQWARLNQYEPKWDLASPNKLKQVHISPRKPELAYMNPIEPE